MTHRTHAHTDARPPTTKSPVAKTLKRAHVTPCCPHGQQRVDVDLSVVCQQCWQQRVDVGLAVVMLPMPLGQNPFSYQRGFDGQGLAA